MECDCQIMQVITLMGEHQGRPQSSHCWGVPVLSVETCVRVEVQLCPFFPSKYSQYRLFYVLMHQPQVFHVCSCFKKQNKHKACVP